MMDRSRWTVIIAEMLSDGLVLGCTTDSIYRMIVTEIIRAWSGDQMSDDDMRLLVRYTRTICDIAKEGQRS